MRCFRIWDVERKEYVARHNRKASDQSCFDSRSSACKVAGRIVGIGKYEIHTFHMERIYEA